MTNLPTPLLVVSPHLDDGVLSCGLLLSQHPAATLCTVFTAPPAENMTTEWDQQSGFHDAFEAMRARKEEDQHATALLGANSLHLPFCDAQYQSTPSQCDLSSTLAQTVVQSGARIVLVPMGLYHSDHGLVSEACIALLTDFPHVEFRAYEDVPYRRIDGMVHARLATLYERGYRLTPCDCSAPDPFGGEPSVQIKRRAIEAYSSQLKAFGPNGRSSLFSGERYWRFENNSLERH